MNLELEYRAQVEKGIPMPVSDNTGRKAKGRPDVGQFAHIKQMEIGDSIAVRDERCANIFASFANKKGWRVARRQVEEGRFGYRVWRTA